MEPNDDTQQPTTDDTQMGGDAEGTVETPVTEGGDGMDGGTSDAGADTEGAMDSEGGTATDEDDDEDEEAAA